MKGIRPRTGHLSLRRGCLWAFCVLALVAVLATTVTLVVRRQIGDVRPSPHQVVSGDADAGAPSSASIDLHLDLVGAQLTILPGVAPRPFEIRADYDEQYYDLEVVEQDQGETVRYEVRFRPHARYLSLLRMKMGEILPRIDVWVPANRVLRITGELQTSFAALEGRGLRLEALDFEIDGGAATVSFLEPLSEPMERFSLVGDKGSLEVTGLGNASPRTVLLDQRLGELDVDLRGAWKRDATIELNVSLAGGSCWLPRDVDVRRSPDERLELETPGEVPSRPQLDLHVNERGGKLVLIQ